MYIACREYRRSLYPFVGIAKYLGAKRESLQPQDHRVVIENVSTHIILGSWGSVANRCKLLGTIWSHYMNLESLLYIGY